MRAKLSNYAPMGRDFEKDIIYFIYGLLGAVIIISLAFYAVYENAYSDLFYNYYGERILREGAMMPPLLDLISIHFIWMSLLFFVTAQGIHTYYRSHFVESQSIYLMRRLPDRWELLRRCVTLPVIGMVSVLITMALLLWLFYWYYVTKTPAVCLYPNHWF